MAVKILRSVDIGWYSLRCPAEATSGRQIEMSIPTAGAHQSVSRVLSNLMRLVHVICSICATCSTSLRWCVPSDFVATLRMFTITHMYLVQLVFLGLSLLIANDLLRYRYRRRVNLPILLQGIGLVGFRCHGGTYLAEISLPHR